MDSDRRSLRWLVFSMLCGLLLAWSPAGCGGGGNDPGPSDPGTGDNEPVHTTLIDGVDRELLSDAAMDYISMLQTTDPAAARAAVVEALAATEGIASATLFEDGYTIYTETDRGARAALNTLDLHAVNAGVGKDTGFGDGSPHGGSEGIAPGKSGFSSDAHAPTSRKVLILVANAPDMDGAQDTANALVGYFTVAGWDAADIDLKVRTTGASTAINPDDLLDFSGYGVVVLFGHALHGAPAGGPPRLYVQACSAVDYASVADPVRSAAWNQMIDDGALVTVGSVAAADESFYLRADLFGSESVGLPSTLFYLVVPFSDRLAPELDQRGAGSVLSWDNVFLAADAYAGVRYFFQAMTGAPTPSDGEVFARSALIKGSHNPEDDSPASLDLFYETSQLYLPAWAAVHFDGLPAGTTNAGIGVNYMVTTAPGVERPSLEMGTATDGELEPLVPVEIVIEGSAADADGNTVAALHFTHQLHAGANALRVDFSRQQVAGIPVRFDWLLGNGRYSTQFFSGFVFDRNPNSNRYKVFTEYQPDGFSVNQPTVYEGQYLYIRSDYCFDQEQLLYIWGSDPFGVTEGHVVWVRSGSLWGNYDPDAMTWDDETGQMMSESAIIDREWAEYLAWANDLTIDVIFQ